MLSNLHAANNPVAGSITNKKTKKEREETVTEYYC